MNRWRKVIGALQMTSCLGLLVGFYIPWLTPIVSFLLAVMMLVALIVRLRLRDSALMTTPAAVYFLLSLYLFFTSVQQL